ncbi:MAG: PilZ domain-containing protein [Deltaproteobacteria bacterium]|nr:PilZ domain-containing protein [Deltaproteobacteria bacterium]
MSTSPPPIFIRSNVRFTLFGHEYVFPAEGVSLFGISSLRSPNFDPTDMVGEQVRIEVDVLSKEPFAFATNAWLTAEATVDNVYLGMKFNLGEKIRSKLVQAIQLEGYYPTNYIRKYPRIPAKDVIPTMPLRAIVSTIDDELLAFDIANMSPNGILLHTENPKAAFLVPSVRVQAQVEPRGSTMAPFDFEGIVCRMMMDMNPVTRNIKRYLGIKFTRIPEEQKQNFLEILKAVLESIQQSGMAG